MNKDTFSMILTVIILIVGLGGLIITNLDAYKTHYLTIDDINSIDVVIGDNRVIFFNIISDGKTYKVKADGRDIDFTVNSRLVLELKYKEHRNNIFCEYERLDDYYDVCRIIKIPD